MEGKNHKALQKIETTYAEGKLVGADSVVVVRVDFRVGAIQHDADFSIEYEHRSNGRGNTLWVFYEHSLGNLQVVVFFQSECDKQIVATVREHPGTGLSAGFRVDFWNHDGSIGDPKGIVNLKIDSKQSFFLAG